MPGPVSFVSDWLMISLPDRSHPPGKQGLLNNFRNITISNRKYLARWFKIHYLKRFTLIRMS